MALGLEWQHRLIRTAEAVLGWKEQHQLKEQELQQLVVLQTALQTALPGIHLGFMALQTVLHSTPGKEQQLQEQVVQARVVLQTIEQQQQLLQEQVVQAGVVLQTVLMTTLLGIDLGITLQEQDVWHLVAGIQMIMEDVYLLVLCVQFVWNLWKMRAPKLCIVRTYSMNIALITG
jgi:hypothetical protein